MERSKLLLLGALGLGVLIQLVPYGRDRTNPTVEAEPGWDSPRTRELFFRACKDCHSYETDWPWYTAVAPPSWLVRWDVDEARSHFNVSAAGGTDEHGDDAAAQVRKGKMPLWYYLPAHPEARLSDEETAALIAGLEKTFGEPDSGEQARPHDHEHRHEAD